VIDKGRLLLVEEKAALMKRMGRKTLRIELHRQGRGACPKASRATISGWSGRTGACR
jgi:hypothetical protein